MPMSKSRQTITIDESLLEKAKAHARTAEKTSLSGYITMLLIRDMKKSDAVKPHSDVDERLKLIEGELNRNMQEMLRLQSELHSAHVAKAKSRDHGFVSVPSQSVQPSHSRKSASG